jgi:hypothetical protein
MHKPVIPHALAEILCGEFAEQPFGGWGRRDHEPAAPQPQARKSA